MAQGPNRTRRFSLPDLADDRVEESVSNFLHGPQRGRGRPEVVPTTQAANPFAGLETRVAWMEALHREHLRNLRYRRSAAVLIVAAEATSGGRAADGWLARVAAPIAHAIARGVRETDLVTRASDVRFHVLLPETTIREARRVADRVVADCEVWLRAVDAPVVVRSAVAGTSHDLTLEAALARALETIVPIGRG